MLIPNEELVEVGSPAPEPVAGIEPATAVAVTVAVVGPLATVLAPDPAVGRDATRDIGGSTPRAPNQSEEHNN